MYDAGSDRDATWEVVATPVRAPDATVVMPVFRQERTVDEAIRSVLAQRDVVLDVIVSDDASPDDTAAIARATIRDVLLDGGVQHGVRFRFGRRRAWRDHLHRLVDAAETDLVIQAHGDDVSRPDRAARVVETFDRTGAAMVVSACDVIDDGGRPVRVVRAGGDRFPVPVEELVRVPEWATGAMQSWRRTALAAFRPLDVERAPVAHDVVLAVRAALVGGVAVIDEPLVRYRKHVGSTTRRLMDQRRPDAEAFAVALHRSMWFDVLAEDLTLAMGPGPMAVEAVLTERTPTTATFDADVAARLAAWLEVERAVESDRLRTSYGRLLVSGRDLLWVDEDELAAANAGTLGPQLRRTAARLAPVRRSLEALRRASHRVTGTIRARSGRSMQ